MTSTTTTPRAMLQPRKHVLRDALRSAADKIEEQAVEIERLTAELESAPMLRYVGIGMLLGMSLGAWALR